MRVPDEARTTPLPATSPDQETSSPPAAEFGPDECEGDFRGCVTRIAARWDPPAIAIEYRPRPNAHRLVHVLDLGPLVIASVQPTIAVDRLMSMPDWPLSPLRVSREKMQRLYAMVLSKWHGPAGVGSPSSGSSTTGSSGRSSVGGSCCSCCSRCGRQSQSRAADQDQEEIATEAASEPPANPDLAASTQRSLASLQARRFWRKAREAAAAEPNATRRHARHPRRRARSSGAASWDSAASCPPAPANTLRQPLAASADHTPVAPTNTPANTLRQPLATAATSASSRRSAAGPIPAAPTNTPANTLRWGHGYRFVEEREDYEGRDATWQRVEDVAAAERDEYAGAAAAGSGATAAGAAAAAASPAAKPVYRVSAGRRARAEMRYQKSAAALDEDLHLSDSSGAATRMRLGASSASDEEEGGGLEAESAESCEEDEVYGGLL